MRTIKAFFVVLKKNGLRYRGFMLVYVLVAAVAAATVVTLDLITGQMGEAAHNFDMDTLLWFLVLLTGVSAVQAIAAAASALMMGRFHGRAGYKFRQNFARYFLHVPFGKLEKAGSGESLSLFTNDVPSAANFVSNGNLQMIADLLTLVAALVFMITINPLFTLIFFALFPVLVVMQVFISKPIQKRAATRLEATEQFNAVVNDSLQNTSTIIAYSLEDVLEKRYLDTYDNFMAAIRKEIVSTLPLTLAGILVSIVPITFINVVAAFSVINDNMGLAEFIAFTAVALNAGAWLMMLSQRLGFLQVTAAGAKRFIENTAEIVEDLHNGTRLDKETTAGVAISFENISFAYGEGDDAPLALDNVSFDITPGSKVAFVGGSGSGKSTVLKLLLGLYTPQSGKISISGRDTNELAVGSLRDTFAYVPQDSFLFPQSIGENIALGNGDVKKLEAACRDAGILDFVNSLPDRFDGVLTEAAENISGGQRQRIALARAFYKDVPVILFDEATSSLDPTTEAGVLASLNDAAQGKTVIMVAHRAAAINACDVIILMDAGKIAAIGRHEDLLAANSMYRNLYEKGANQNGQNGQ